MVEWLNIRLLLSILLFSIMGSSCKVDKSGEAGESPSIYPSDFAAFTEDSLVHAFIEIPAGTLKKNEWDYTSRSLVKATGNGNPRIVKYIPFPCNYGFVSGTLLDEKNGGDEDPLDIIVIGETVTAPSVLKCRVIGVLKLIDRGEKDDKLIAVLPESDVHTLSDFDTTYIGALGILETWFTNYKGQGITISQGFGDEVEAFQLLKKARLE